MEESRSGRTPTDAAGLVREVTALVSLPEVAARVIGLVDDPRATAAQLGEVISKDPNLTMRLLRVANSSYYSRTGGVDTIARAVAVIGDRQVRDITIGLAAVRAFAGLPIEVISMDDFWIHSLYCATIARSVAANADPALADAAFIGGLLHDVGHIVMYMLRPEESRRALWMATEGPDDMTDATAEKQVFGFDHAEVGLELARRWRLPASLREAIAWHHEPGRAPAEQGLLAAVVHVANSLAYCAEVDSADLFTGPPMDAGAVRRTGFDSRLVADLVANARRDFAEARRLFSV